MKTAQEVSEQIKSNLVPHLQQEDIKQIAEISNLIDSEVLRLIEIRKKSHQINTDGYIEVNFHLTDSVIKDLESFGYIITYLPYSKCMGGNESAKCKISWD